MRCRNLLTFHQRLMARFLERRGWCVFYLEPQARKCVIPGKAIGNCWLHLYEAERQKNKYPGNEHYA